MNPTNPFGANPPAYPHQTPGDGGYRGTMRASSAPEVSVLTDQERMARLGKLAVQYELSGGAVCKLRMLEEYDIVIIADDSGSMTQRAHPVPKNDPLAMVPSRWNELCQRVMDILQFSTALDKDGIDIYFLNRGVARNITTPEDAKRLFETPPGGSTPLLDTYRLVLRDKSTSNKETKTLILIATDGEPNRKEAFIRFIEGRDSPHLWPTSFMACTDDEEEIEWLNQLKKAAYIDVLDDYKSEKKEVLAAQNDLIRFTKGDYIVKHLLGAIDPTYGNLDKKRLTPQELSAYNGN